MAIGAFFDIDGTLYRDSLMIEHFKKLLKYEVLDQALWHSKIKKTYENWDKRRGNYDDYMLELANIYIESLKGMDQYKMDFITSQVVDLQGDRVYVFTRDRIEWHKKQGHAVFFISGSPDYLVQKMADRYGITECIGSMYLTDTQGKYTGEVIRMWDADSKEVAIGQLVKRYSIDLSASYAYGDTNGDISMFQKVGHAVAFNPTRELLTNLRSDPKLCAKTQVIVERKDVIYQLDPTVMFMAPGGTDPIE